MGRSRKWLRRLWRDAEVGLAALGQGFGLFTVPECYGIVPVYGFGPDQRALGPHPGHPERLVDAPLTGLTAQERELWAQLEDVWEGADPELRTMRSRPPKPRPRHE